MKNRHRPSLSGLFAMTILVFSMVSTPLLLDASAQSADIEVSSVGFDKTVIIEFKNKSNKNVSEIRIWAPTDVNIQSFKSEDGWTGKKNSVGVIIFTADTPMKSEEIVKIGLKTDAMKSKINWKALDTAGKQVGIGVSNPGEPTPPEEIDNPIKPPEENPEKPEQPPKVKPGAIYDTSTFRLIPDTPKVGDTIRVVGMSFASNEKLNFYIDGKKISPLETNSQGNFVITSKISDNLSPSRVDFEIRDSSGNSKKISLRVYESENRGNPGKSELPLTVNGLKDVIHRGEVLEITGTSKRGSTATIQILGIDGSIITSEPIQVDGNGDWSFETIISDDTPYGRYNVVVTDGTTTIEKSWELVSSKIIDMTPTTLRFEPGDIIKFTGRAVPDEVIEFILEDPRGTVIASEIKQVESNGYVEFTYQTEQSTQKGTYVLLAKQQEDTEILLTGLGELPKEHIVAKLDKLNYKKRDIAIVSIDGPASATLNLLVIDSADKKEFEDDNVLLQPDGKLTYRLDLKNYTSGVYTLVLSRANTNTSEEFSLGLQYGSGQISIGTTKRTYQSNDPIQILGETNGNVLVLIQMIDPNGKVVKEKETFTKKEGRISDDTFRIPNDALLGMWQIKASSGPNFATKDIEVASQVQEEMNVIIENISNMPGIGNVVKFSIMGASSTIEITITNREGEEIGMLRAPYTDDGISSSFWPIPKDLPPDVYTITAKDAYNSGSESFTLEG